MYRLIASILAVGILVALAAAPATANNGNGNGPTIYHFQNDEIEMFIGWTSDPAWVLYINSPTTNGDFLRHNNDDSWNANIHARGEMRFYWLDEYDPFDLPETPDMTGSGHFYWGGKVGIFDESIYPAQSHNFGPAGQTQLNVSADLVDANDDEYTLDIVIVINANGDLVSFHFDNGPQPAN